MGYDVHITRAEQWLDSPSTPISLQEWFDYLKSDPEFRLDGFAEATTPERDTVRSEDESLAVWTAYSRNDVEGNKAWFQWADGEVVVKNPDKEILGKMIAISKVLGGRVQGDDGEGYPPRS